MNQPPAPSPGPPPWGASDDPQWSPAPITGQRVGGSPRDLRWSLVWLVGVLALLTGTFLPWLYSGRVAKNSYQLVGVGQRRLSLPGWAEVMLGLWPFIGPLWAVLAVLYIVRLRRVAAALAVAAATVSGLVALTVIAITAGIQTQFVSAALAGPIVCALGAVLTLAGAGAVLTRRRVTQQSATD